MNPLYLRTVPGTAVALVEFMIPDVFRRATIAFNPPSAMMPESPQVTLIELHKPVRREHR
jgi:hypothetical protein